MTNRATEPTNRARPAFRFGGMVRNAPQTDADIEDLSGTPSDWGRSQDARITRESFAKWLLLLAIGLVDGFWIANTNFHLAIKTETAPLVLSSILIASAAWACLFWRRQIRLFVLFDTFAQFIVLGGVGSTLSYLVLSTDLPLVDRYLSAADYALGFDWPRFVLWVQTKPWLDYALRLVYGGWLFEWLLVPLTVCYRDEARVRELSGTILISVMMTFAISGLVPAISAYPYYAAMHPALMPRMGATDLLGLRDGTLRVIDLTSLRGLVSFPSFHVAVAVLFTWALRGMRFGLVVGALYNAAVVISTLSAGGHYLIDTLGGAVIAVLAIAAYHGIARTRRL
ncbi:MAG: hypothetical protein JWM91_349 [Rhodospirillales bacterium]|nr:hypothetical protein [Rhodospirillales bacterium]